MRRSRGVVLMLSHDALKKFKTIQADHPSSQTDNLLLEWTLALVLLELGVLGFVFPVFCGDYEEDDQGGLGLGKFDFKCAQGLPDVVPKVFIAVPIFVNAFADCSVGTHL